MRQKGRSVAWADLEDRLSSNIGLLVSTGMLAPNQWVAMMISIEDFRKQEQGTTELPGDLLEKWLSSPLPPKVVVPQSLTPKKQGRRVKDG